MLCAVAGITNAQTFTEEVEMTGTAGSGNYAPNVAHGKQARSKQH